MNGKSLSALNREKTLLVLSLEQLEKFPIAITELWDQAIQELDIPYIMLAGAPWRVLESHHMPSVQNNLTS